MYKTTSNNSQSRATRSTVNSTLNQHGVDPSAFGQEQGPDEWEVLSLRKKQIEARFAELKDHIVGAQRRNDWNGVSKWQRERANLSHELLTKLEPRLSELRKVRRQKYHQNDWDRTNNSLEAAFMLLAKDLLAKPVYDRILTAAIHRCGEQHDKSHEGWGS